MSIIPQKIVDRIVVFMKLLCITMTGFVLTRAVKQLIFLIARLIILIVR